MLTMASSCNFRFGRFFSVLYFVSGFSVKVKLSVPLLCVCALPGKAIPNMVYTLLGIMLNPTHSLTHFVIAGWFCCCCWQLFVPLRRGCIQNLVNLDLSGNYYKKPLPRELTVPNAWKEFFSASCCLQRINLSNTRLPAEAVKYVFSALLHFSSENHSCS